MALLTSPPIAEGRTALIYAWDERRVLKLFRDWCPPGWVDYEAQIARAVHAAGLPAPAPGEIVDADGRRGLLYERLEGRSMLEDMKARPWMIWKHARTLAELHASIHRKSIAGLPSYEDRLRADIDEAPSLSGELRREALASLAQLPRGESVCHGDLHPGNVILTNRGAVVIDWMTACTGNRHADAARTSLLLSIGARAAGERINPIVRAAIDLYHRTYLRRYRRLQPDPAGEIARWLPVVAAARLNENILPEQDVLTGIVRHGLSR